MYNSQHLFVYIRNIFWYLRLLTVCFRSLNTKEEMENKIDSMKFAEWCNKASPSSDVFYSSLTPTLCFPPMPAWLPKEMCGSNGYQVPQLSLASHSTLVAVLNSRGLDRWTEGQVKNWLAYFCWSIADGCL